MITYSRPTDSAKTQTQNETKVHKAFTISETVKIKMF